MNSLSFQGPGGFSGIEPVDYRPDAGHNSRPLGAGFAGFNAEHGGSPDIVGGAGGAEQRLAGNAARPGAVTPQPGGFHNGHPLAEAGREPGRGQARRTSPNDHKVIAVMSGTSGSHPMMSAVVRRAKVQGQRLLAPAGHTQQPSFIEGSSGKLHSQGQAGLADSGRHYHGGQPRRGPGGLEGRVSGGVQVPGRRRGGWPASGERPPAGPRWSSPDGTRDGGGWAWR